MPKISLLPDLFISLPAILLLSLGILVIYSSEPQLAFQQGLIALVGLFLYWVLSFVDFDTYKQYADYLYWGILVLLLVVFLLGVETRGSLRWIQLGALQFQPSEFVKPILILFLAKFWSGRLPSWRNIVKSLLWVLPAMILIFKQPDLGTTLTLFVIWLIMLLGANISIVKLALMGLAAVIFGPIGWLFLKSYQRERILSFFSPGQDPLGVGYNVIQSVIAVGSGQLGGRGLGRGTQSRLQFLPEFRTDFVFASIAEEFGFVGSMIVLILYGVIIAQSLQILNRSSDQFANQLILGVLGMLFFQTTVNIGMNLGVVPITGITLPLLSAGGSSLIATLISLGFIAAVSRYTKNSR